MYYRRKMTYTHCRDGMMFIQPADKDKLIRLSGTARRIWETLDYPISIKETAKIMAAEYSEEIGIITRETAAFITSLHQSGLLEESDAEPSPADRNRYRYLSLLKRSLINLLYPEHELRISFLEKQNAGNNDLERKRYMRDIRYREPDLYQSVIDAKHNIGLSQKAIYRFSHTMIGVPALDNLERCAEIVFAENIRGDFMEAGVCQGGAAIFLRALQIAYGEENRRLWAADSFKGLPPSESEPDLAAGINLCEEKAPFVAFCLEGVRDNFSRYDLLDEKVFFLPGFFADTLPDAPIGPLAILRLDADLYASTRVALENLYPKVSPGGFIIVDDYGFFTVCRQAVDEYRQKHNITEPIHFINPSCVYWRKQT